MFGWFKRKYYYTIITTSTDGDSLDIYSIGGDRRMTKEEAWDRVAQETENWPIPFIVGRSRGHYTKFAKNKISINEQDMSGYEPDMSGYSTGLKNWN